MKRLSLVLVALFFPLKAFSQLKATVNDEGGWNTKTENCYATLIANHLSVKYPAVLEHRLAGLRDKPAPFEHSNHGAAQFGDSDTDGYCVKFQVASAPKEKDGDVSCAVDFIKVYVKTANDGVNDYQVMEGGCRYRWNSGSYNKKDRDFVYFKSFTTDLVTAKKSPAPLGLEMNGKVTRDADGKVIWVDKY